MNTYTSQNIGLSLPKKTPFFVLPVLINSVIQYCELVCHFRQPCLIVLVLCDTDKINFRGKKEEFHFSDWNRNLTSTGQEKISLKLHKSVTRPTLAIQQYHIIKPSLTYFFSPRIYQRQIFILISTSPNPNHSDMTMLRT